MTHHVFDGSATVGDYWCSLTPLMICGVSPLVSDMKKQQFTNRRHGAIFHAPKPAARPARAGLQTRRASAAPWPSDWVVHHPPSVLARPTPWLYSHTPRQGWRAEAAATRAVRGPPASVAPLTLPSSAPPCRPARMARRSCPRDTPRAARRGKSWRDDWNNLFTVQTNVQRNAKGATEHRRSVQTTTQTDHQQHTQQERGTRLPSRQKMSPKDQKGSAIELASCDD